VPLRGLSRHAADSTGIRAGRRALEPMDAFRIEVRVDHPLETPPMTTRRPTYVALAVLALTASTRAADDEGPAVTVYSSADPAGFDPQQFVAQQRMGGDPFFAAQVPGFGVVKETRPAKLAAGVTDLRFTDVAQFIDPTTVSIVDMTDPEGTTVLEQNFQFDLASPTKILERYVDKEIGWVAEKDGQVVKSLTGKLLSTNQGQLVLQTPEGLRFLPWNDPGLRLPALPEGLITRPTLVWKLSSAQGGDHKVRTTYQTQGMTWRADYNVVLSADDKTADVGAWVSLMNLSGASFKNARLKLIAGDVHRVQPPQMTRGGFRGAKAESLDAAGFEEKAFFEYHLYTLPRRTDVLENSTQQLTLFPTAHGVPVEKVLVYYGLPDAANWGFFPEPRTDRELSGQWSPKVDTYVRFRNSKDAHMGMPLPKGKVRVYKEDAADGSLEFVGEDLVDHTPRDETVLVKLGEAFDVVGERRQTDFRVETRDRWMQETIEVRLRNHKDTPVRVLVKENLYRWSKWEVLEKSDDFRKEDARTIFFDVEVPPNGAKTVTYTVKYSW
jgi:hypothetical protein